MKKLCLLFVLLLACCSNPTMKDNRQAVVNIQSIVGEGVGVLVDNVNGDSGGLYGVLTAAHLFEPSQLIDDDIMYMNTIDIAIENGIYNTAKILIPGERGDPPRAALLGIDFEEDLALLVVDLKDKRPVVELSEAKGVHYGQEIYAITAIPGVNYPLTAFDKVGGYNMTKVDDSETPLKNACIQTQFVMGPGSSGTPVFDIDNKLIGLHVVVLRTEEDPPTRFSFARPAWKIRDFLKRANTYLYCVGTKFQCDVIKGEGRLLKEYVKGFK